MSFDKYYKNRKDWRKQYKNSKAFDRTCRNHGSCSYCESNRTYSDKKARLTADEEIKYYSNIHNLEELEEYEETINEDGLYCCLSSANTT